MNRALTFVLLLAMVLFVPGIADAHVSVQATPSETSSANAKLDFKVASESETAAITKVEIQPPSEMDLTSFKLASAPSGWNMQLGSTTLVVSGGGLTAGQDLPLAFEVAKLPATPTSEFKVLQTYESGRVDRWIELRASNNPDPEMPAAVLTLTAAASDVPTTTTLPAKPEEASNDDGVNNLVVAVVGLLALLGVMAVLVTRRRK